MKTNVIGLLSGVALATSGIVLGGSNPASAAVLWNWSYSGSGSVSGSGTFTTTDQQSDGSYLVTGITGTVGSGIVDRTITSLLAPGTFQGNDNLLFATNPQLTFGGVAFEVTEVGTIPPITLPGNFYYDPGTVRPVGYYVNTGAEILPIQFTATAQVNPPTGVPESSNLLGLIALGGLMLGSAVRKAK